MTRPKIHLSISPSGVEVTIGSTGVTHTTRGSLLLAPREGKAMVVEVGEDLEQVGPRLEALKRAGSIPDDFSLLEPGSNPWWDAQWAWPPRSSSGLVSPAEDSSALIINPLRDETWSPRLISALVLYALAQANPKLFSWEGAFRGHLLLAISPEFTSLQRAEILDVVIGVWGRSRVQGHEDIPRLPPGLEDFGSWALLLGLLALAVLRTRYHLGDPASLLFLVLLFISSYIVHRAKMKSQSEAPRRKSLPHNG